MSLNGWREAHVAPAEFDLQITRPKSQIELESVSPRLVRELTHPGRTDFFASVAFTPDSERLVARGFPSGITQVWEVSSGRSLTRIDTGGDRFCQWRVAPDGAAGYLSRNGLTETLVERNGKTLQRREYRGDIRQWDLATGQLTGTFQFTPSRGISSFCISADSKQMVTFERHSGEYERSVPWTTSLWNLTTGQSLTVADDLHGGMAQLSADGKTLLGTQFDDKNYLLAMKLIDMESTKPRLTIPVEGKLRQSANFVMSANASLVATSLYSEVTEQTWLKVWNGRTGEEVLSFAADPGDLLNWVAFSPDDRTLAVTSYADEGPKLLVFDIATRKLTMTVRLGPKASVGDPVFNPDGRWVLVVTQVAADETGQRFRDPLEMPQGRIYLIEAATGTIRETLVAPQGLLGSVEFSPDGTRFATPTTGKVLLWDFTKLPK